MKSQWFVRQSVSTVYRSEVQERDGRENTVHTYLPAKDRDDAIDMVNAVQGCVLSRWSEPGSTFIIQYRRSFDVVLKLVDYRTGKSIYLTQDMARDVLEQFTSSDEKVADAAE